MSVSNIVLTKAVGFVSLVVFVVDAHVIILLTDVTLTVSTVSDTIISCARHSILKRQFGLLQSDGEVHACL